MNNILEKLLSFGFEKLDENSLRINILPGIFFQLTTDDVVWEKPQQLHFYLFSSCFGKLMSLAFNSSNQEFFSSYEPRKLRKDKDGCLGMALLLLDTSNNEVNLSSGKTTTSLDDLLCLLNRIKSHRNLFDEIYKGELGKLLVFVEGVWIYLYLCQEIGLSDEETLSQLNAEFMENPKRKWRPLKWPDIHLTNTISTLYHNVCR